MNAWWFFLLLATIMLALLKTHNTIRLYFVAQLINALAVFVSAHWLQHFYLVVYMVTTVPIIECCMFMLWDTGVTKRQYWISLNFGLLMGVLGAYYAGNWRAGTYVTFVEGVLLSVNGMALALTTVGKREWAAIRSIGALCLLLSCYDFAFVRGWKDSNTWLPAAICAFIFGRIALR